MKFIPSPLLEEDMVISEDLYGFSNNNLLLAKSHKLSKSEIQRMQSLKHKGAFVYNNEIQKEIEKEKKVGEIKNKAAIFSAVKTLRRAFNQIVEENLAVNSEALKIIPNVVYDIVDDIMKNKDATISLLDLKNFDDYIYEHSVKVCIYSILIGVEAGFNKHKLCDLGVGAILHDIGKMFVPKELLEKKEKLTDEEFDIIKRHSILGYEYLRKSPNINLIPQLIALMHHETPNGTGYPMGLVSDKQTIYSKIVSIADVYDAMTSNRSYRKALPPAEAIEHILGNVDTMFDYDMVKFFIKKIQPYPIGSTVLLSNGNKAEVISLNQANCLRPKIRLLKNNDDNSDENAEEEQNKYIDNNIYDLYNNNSLYNITIKEMLC